MDTRLDTRFWRTFGKALARERERRSWNYEDIAREGGPVPNTAIAHEKGHIRTLLALSRHLDAFGWQLTDVLANVLKEHQKTHADDAINPTARDAFWRRFSSLTDEGQHAVEMVMREMPTRPASSAASRESPPARKPSSSGTALAQGAHPRKRRSA